MSLDGAPSEGRPETVAPSRRSSLRARPLLPAPALASTQFWIHIANQHHLLTRGSVQDLMQPPVSAPRPIGACDSCVERARRRESTDRQSSAVSSPNVPDHQVPRCSCWCSELQASADALSRFVLDRVVTSRTNIDSSELVPEDSFSNHRGNDGRSTYRGQNQSSERWEADPEDDGARSTRGNWTGSTRRRRNRRGQRRRQFQSPLADFSYENYEAYLEDRRTRGLDPWGAMDYLAWQSEQARQSSAEYLRRQGSINRFAERNAYYNFSGFLRGD